MDEQRLLQHLSSRGGARRRIHSPRCPPPSQQRHGFFISKLVISIFHIYHEVGIFLHRFESISAPRILPTQTCGWMHTFSKEETTTRIHGSMHQCSPRRPYVLQTDAWLSRPCWILFLFPPFDPHPLEVKLDWLTRIDRHLPNKSNKSGRGWRRRPRRGSHREETRGRDGGVTGQGGRPLRALRHHGEPHLPPYLVLQPGLRDDRRGPVSY